VQLGTDLARHNVNGWNVHLGTTVGYLEAQGHLGSDSISLVTEIGKSNARRNQLAQPPCGAT